MKHPVGIIIISLFILVLSGCFKENRGPATGVLYGKVNVSPLCPVEPCNLSPSELKIFYGNRKIIVYELDTTTVVARFQLGIESAYQFVLDTGDYILDINYYENDISPDVPSKVTVAAGLTYILNIDLDTNIQ